MKKNKADRIGLTPFRISGTELSSLKKKNVKVYAIREKGKGRGRERKREEI